MIGGRSVCGGQRCYDGGDHDGGDVDDGGGDGDY